MSDVKSNFLGGGCDSNVDSSLLFFFLLLVVLFCGCDGFGRC